MRDKTKIDATSYMVYTGKQCPVCGKDFWLSDASMWSYKKPRRGKNKSMHPLYFCSWTCMRKWEKDNPMRRSSTYWDYDYIW